MKLMISGKKRNRWVNIILIILIYLIVYNPPIFTINCIRLLMIPCWIYLYINRQYLQKYISIKKVFTVEVIISTLLLYCITIAFFNSNSPTNFTHLFYWIAGDIPFALCVWVFLKKRNQGFSELFRDVIITGVIMSITAVLALISPAAKSVFTQRMIDYGVLYADRLSAYRNYGFAANLTSFASMLQAVLAVFCIFQVVKGKRRYLFAVPTLIISAIINTRSSILFLAVGILAILVFVLSKHNASYIFRHVAIIIGLLVISGFCLQIIQKYNSQTFSWLNSGYNSILSFITGSDRDSGYFGELRTMTVDSFPTGFDLILGVGSGVMGEAGAAYGARSDVGFINDLWRGGLFYSIALLILYITMLTHLYKSKVGNKEFTRFISVFFLLIFIMTNIKGSFFIHSDLTVVFWLFYTALVFNSENKDRYKIVFTIKR